MTSTPPLWVIEFARRLHAEGVGLWQAAPKIRLEVDKKIAAGDLETLWWQLNDPFHGAEQIMGIWEHEQATENL